jgi:hypothetical protein
MPSEVGGGWWIVDRGKARVGADGFSINHQLSTINPLQDCGVTAALRVVNATVRVQLPAS